jgi:hypothetical protein
MRRSAWTEWFGGAARNRRRQMACLVVAMAGATVAALLWANTSSAGGHHLNASSHTTSTSMVTSSTAAVITTTVAGGSQKRPTTIHSQTTTEAPVARVAVDTTTEAPRVSASANVRRPTTAPPTVPSTTTTTVPADLANCSVPEPGVLVPQDESGFLQHLVGTWLLCRAPSVFGTNEVGIEIPADGQWSKLTRISSGQLVRIPGWGNQGTWEIDAGVTQSPFQVNFQIHGSGTVYTQPVFSSAAPKMRLNNEGVDIADHVPTTETIVPR